MESGDRYNITASETWSSRPTTPNQDSGAEYVEQRASSNLIGLNHPIYTKDINHESTMSSSNPYDNDAHSINEDDLIDPDDGIL